MKTNKPTDWVLHRLKAFNRELSSWSDSFSELDLDISEDRLVFEILLLKMKVKHYIELREADNS